MTQLPSSEQAARGEAPAPETAPTVSPVPVGPAPVGTGQRQRKLPAWIIAIPLMALTGIGGYLLHTPDAAPAGGPGAGSYGGAARQGTAGTGAVTTGTAAGTGQSGARQSRRGNFGRGSGAVIAVTASTAKSGTLSTTRAVAGTVTAYKNTNVMSQLSGTVTKIESSAGKDVQAGQTVVELSNPDQNASVASAENALQSAQAQLLNQTSVVNASRAQLQTLVQSAQDALSNTQSVYQQQQQLYKVGAIAKSALDAQLVTVKQAQGALATAQTNLTQNNISATSGLQSLQISVDKARIAYQQAKADAANVRITAPYDGQITNVAVANGQYLTAGTQAFTLVSRERTVNFNVPPTQASALTPGQTLTYQVGTQSYPVKITTNAGAPVNGSVAITATFNEANQPALGTVGNVNFSSAVGTGVLVPTTALVVDNANVAVYVIQAGRAQMKDVQVIGQTGDTAVVSGIQGGQQVISEPPSGMLSGTHVTTNAASAHAGGAGTSSRQTSQGQTSQGTSAAGAATTEGSAAPADSATGTQKRRNKTTSAAETTGQATQTPAAQTNGESK